MAERKDLIQIIKDNPGAVVVVDNDFWYLQKAEDPKDPFDENDEDAWYDRQRLASSDDKFKNQDHERNCYGEGVLYALAEIVGIRVEGV